MTLRISLCTKSSEEGIVVEWAKTELRFGQDLCGRRQ